MGVPQRFSESEILAQTLNRREAKHLRERMERLVDDKVEFVDEFDKERKSVIEFQKQSRLSTGSSVFSEEDCSGEVDRKMLQRFSRPWSITPHETSYNALYREIASANMAETSLVYKRLVNKFNPSRNGSSSRKTMSGSARSSVRTSCDIFGMNRLLSGKSSSLKGENVLNNEMENNLPTNEKTEVEEKPLHAKKTLVSFESSTIASKVDGLDSYFKEPELLHGNKNGCEKTTDSTTKYYDEGNSNIVKEPAKSSAEQNEIKPYTDCVPFRERETLVIKLRLPGLPRAQLGSEVDASLLQRNNSRMEIQRSNNFMDVAKQQQVQTAPKLQLVRDTNTTTSTKHDQLTENASKNSGNDLAELTKSENVETVQNGPSVLSPREASFCIDEALEFRNDKQLNVTSVTVYKGMKIRNYVPPQLRYKHDPFRISRRERLIAKIGKDKPDWVEQQKEKTINAELKFSKICRERLHNELVRKNSALQEGRRKSIHAESLNMEKIGEFLKSIDYLRCETDDRSRSRHPLLA